MSIHLDPTPAGSDPKTMPPRRVFMLTRMSPKDPIIVEREHILIRDGWLTFWDGGPMVDSSNVLAYSAALERISCVEEIVDPEKLDELLDSQLTTAQLEERYPALRTPAEPELHEEEEATVRPVGKFADAISGDEVFQTVPPESDERPQLWRPGDDEAQTDAEREAEADEIFGVVREKNRCAFCEGAISRYKREDQDVNEGWSHDDADTTTLAYDHVPTPRDLSFS